MFELTPYFRSNRKSAQVYDPFREMEDMERRFFGNSVQSFRSDIKDEGNAYLIETDMPGFRKEDIHIDIDDDILTIKAEHTESKDNSGDKGASKDKDSYIRRERYYGAYTRSFNVSEIDVESIKAAYENGVLTLTMPKKAPVKPESKHLEIE